MSATAIVTMVCVGGMIWGGLIVFLILALRKERRKN